VIFSQDAAMKHDSRIYVAGHLGLAGSAIHRRLLADGYADCITRTHSELDLEHPAAVEEFFAQKKPAYVFLAAARVGGIWANSLYPADFLLSNLKIQNHVIEASWRHGVKGLIFLGSSCIYPKLAAQPLKPQYLLTGPLEPTNEPYAIAKIAGIKLCQAFNRQHGTSFLSVMPTNLYGPNDHYDLEHSHVLPAMIRKFHLAKQAAKGDWQSISQDEAHYGKIPEDVLLGLRREAGPVVRLWGSGSPRREFLFSEDMADACVFLLKRLPEMFSAAHPRRASHGPAQHLVNIGCGVDHTIRELAERVATVIGFTGPVEWDHSKPDGTPQKLLDTSALGQMGWSPRISLEEGIRLAYRDYLSKIR
jgi:GDP-L-fucose synthase